MAHETPPFHGKCHFKFSFFKPFPKSVSVAIHLLFRYYRYIKCYFEDQCWRVFITIEEKPWNWVPRLCDIILELMHFLSFLHKIVLILQPDRFQDKILESPQCRHVRLCMSRVPWKYLLQSSFFIVNIFYPKMELYRKSCIRRLKSPS